MQLSGLAGISAATIFGLDSIPHPGTREVFSSHPLSLSLFEQQSQLKTSENSTPRLAVSADSGGWELGADLNRSQMGSERHTAH